MKRHAASLTDLDRIWSTPAGSALLEAALDGQDVDHAEVVTADGADASVLPGGGASLAALVGGLLEQGVRVYEESDGISGVTRAKWARVHTAPLAADLPDERPALTPDDESPRIDQEFAALCGMQTPAERAGLRASIAEHGCRDPLVVWEERDVLLDGHNRLAVCRELDVSFETVEYSFPGRTAARNWIIDNALARRSLSTAQRRYLRGKRHLAERRDKTENLRRGNDAPIPQVEASGKTAGRIAEREGVSRATIERDAEFARALDALGAKGRGAILAGEVKLSRALLARAAEQGVRSVSGLVALKESAAAAPEPDPLARLDALAARVSRLVDEVLSQARQPDDRARLANVWALGADVGRLAAAIPAAPAEEVPSHG